MSEARSTGKPFISSFLFSDHINSCPPTLPRPPLLSLLTGCHTWGFQHHEQVPPPARTLSLPRLRDAAPSHVAECPGSWGVSPPTEGVKPRRSRPFILHVRTSHPPAWPGRGEAGTGRTATSTMCTERAHPRQQFGCNRGRVMTGLRRRQELFRGGRYVEPRRRHRALFLRGIPPARKLLSSNKAHDPPPALLLPRASVSADHARSTAHAKRSASVPVRRARIVYPYLSASAPAMDCFTSDLRPSGFSRTRARARKEAEAAFGRCLVEGGGR